MLWPNSRITLVTRTLSRAPQRSLIINSKASIEEGYTIYSFISYQTLLKMKYSHKIANSNDGSSCMLGCATLPFIEGWLTGRLLMKI